MPENMPTASHVLLSTLFLLYLTPLNGGVRALNFALPLKFENNNSFVAEYANDTNKAPTFKSKGYQGINMYDMTANPNDYRDAVQKYNVGRLRYNQSLKFPFGAFPSFSTSFTFVIETTTPYNQSGDGIAFALTNDAVPPLNSTGRFLGLTPQNTNDQQDHTFIALEFDTFMNPSTVDPGFDDPSSSHIGINVNTLNSTAVYDTAFNDSPLYLYRNYCIKAWLEYDASRASVRVWATNVTLVGSDLVDRPSTPILEARNLNLSQKIHTNELYAIIIAASGNNSEGHYLFAWSFSSSESPEPIPHHSRSNLTPILGVVSALLGLLLAIDIFFGVRILYRRRRRRQPPFDQSTFRAAPPLSPLDSIQKYSYDDFSRACGNFSGGTIVGEGGCGIVYRAVLSEGVEVAVKKMKQVVVRKDFYREVDILRRLNHPNLLPLLAWCSNDSTGSDTNLTEASDGRRRIDEHASNSVAPAPDLSPGSGKGRETPASSDDGDKAAVSMLLVYPYIRNGSLERYIGSGDMAVRQQLGRDRRLQILCQVSEALAYLHGQNCVHRDVKPSNVLLTEEFEAKVGDFGLARLGNPDRTRVTVTEVAAGTPGFMAPELVLEGWAQAAIGVIDEEAGETTDASTSDREESLGAASQQAVTYKADVYSFGVLALKVASGQLYSFSDVPRLGSALQRSMDAFDHRDFVALLDPALRQEEVGALELQQWRCVFLLGLRCLSRSPAERPPMAKVSQALRAVRLAQFPDILDSLLLQL